jgi:hypothetical protein
MIAQLKIQEKALFVNKMKEYAAGGRQSRKVLIEVDFHPVRIDGTCY